MGTRPELSLLMAITDLEVRDYEITDLRWHAEGDWEEILVPIPNEEEVEALRKRAFGDNKDSDAFYRLIDLHSAKALALKDCPDEPPRQRQVYELVGWDPEYGLPNIIGYEICRHYATEVVYALPEVLRSRLPDIDFGSPQWFELQKVAPEEDYSVGASWYVLKQAGHDIPQEALGDLRMYERLLERGHNYVQFRMEVLGYVGAAMYLLHETLGMDIEPKDLQLGLYWHFG